VNIGILGSNISNLATSLVKAGAKVNKKIGFYE